MKGILLALTLLIPNVVLADEFDKVGDWFVTKEENKLTDQIDYFAIVSAVDKDASIVLRCVNNKTEAYITMKDYMGISYSYDSEVTLRLDKGKLITQNWLLGDGGTSLFSPKSVTFIKSLIGKKNLIIGYNPYGKTQVIAEFKIDEIDTIANEISSACHWKLK